MLWRQPRSLSPFIELIPDACRATITQIPKRRQDIRDLTYFPIERARMRSMPILFAVFGATTFAYGWLVHYRVHLAAPLVFTFFNGFSIMLMFNAVGMLAV